MNEGFQQNNKRIFKKINEGGFVNVHEISKKIYADDFEYRLSMDRN